MSTEEGHEQQEKDESQEELRPSRMTVREQQIGFAVAGVGGAIGIAVAAANGQPVLAVLAGVAAIGVGISCRYRHRIVSAFVAILGGFLLPVPVNFAFLGYGGYVMFRSSRAQAKLRASQPRLSPEQRREARDARRAAKRGEPAPVVKRPTKNRRYTPPKAKARPGRQR